MKRYLLTGLIILAAAGAYVAFRPPAFEGTVEGQSLSKIEIANSREEQIQGLSGRTRIPDDYGMLFVFDTPDSYGFWMKDMEVPIDIIWLADDGEILRIEEAVSPDSYPKSFYPPRPVRHVLEVRAGLSKERGWGTGTTLTLPSILD